MELSPSFRFVDNKQQQQLLLSRFADGCICVGSKKQAPFSRLYGLAWNSCYLIQWPCATSTLNSFSSNHFLLRRAQNWTNFNGWFLLATTFVMSVLISNPWHLFNGSILRTLHYHVTVGLRLRKDKWPMIFGHFSFNQCALLFLLCNIFLKR